MINTRPPRVIRTTTGVLTLLLAVSCLVVVWLQGASGEASTGRLGAVWVGVVTLIVLGIDVALGYVYGDTPPRRIGLLAVGAHVALVESAVMVGSLAYTSILYLTFYSRLPRTRPRCAHCCLARTTPASAPNWCRCSPRPPLAA